MIEELVKRAKNDDSEALAEILSRFRYFIIKYAARYNIPSCDFEDLVQHGYLSVIKAVRMYNLEKKSFTTYCNSAVINNFNSLLKGDIKHFREVQDEGLLNAQPYAFTLEDEVIAYEETRKLYEGLDQLSDNEKRLIQAIYMKGMSIKEAAADLDIDYRKALKVRKKSLEKLKLWWQPNDM